MGCHTWFFSSKINQEKQLCCEFHDIFRSSGFHENIIGSYDETIKYIKENNCVFTEEMDENLKKFWTKYPNGKIDFG